MNQVYEIVSDKQVYDALLNPEKDVSLHISPIPPTFCEREIEFRHIVEVN